MVRKVMFSTNSSDPSGLRYQGVGGGGGARPPPPPILADQKSPPAVPARHLSKCPPRFLDFGTCLIIVDIKVSKEDSNTAAAR